MQFAQALQQFGVDTLQDINDDLINNSEFERKIKSIPGQGSGISLQYFLMLSGSNDFIKPDRMIIRFLETYLERTVKIEEAQPLLREASAELKIKYPNMTPRLLDGVIWGYLSSN